MTKKRNYFRHLLIILIAGSALMLLTGCGQKGPLYLPKNGLSDNATPNNAMPDNAMPDNAMPDNAMPDKSNV